ncbi:dnaJ homolog subfamily C member 4-like [Lytechinus pictus]|uniref:dnaJ homolog subfamily C member 4-like n=1 Tax=Lytechinus pictus TaxID=7653 RepID=UPI00240E8694|nr:dnaJ homolog subfamily C member 4-like [Lytechinus pictus]
MPFTNAFTLCTRCQHKLILQSLHHVRGITTGIRLRSQTQSNHYETLGLPKDATSLEIKAAYFELSKMLHPDANPQNPDQHDRFVQLSEAYGILSKTTSRREYDLSLTRPHVKEIRVHNMDVSPDNPFGGHSEADWFPRTHIFRAGGDEKVNENYYGIKGLRRVRNSYVVYGCIAFIFTGAVFHFFVFKQSSQYATQRLDAKDRKIAELYNEAKERARKNGPRKQMELLRERHNANQMKLAKQLEGDT